MENVWERNENEVKSAFVDWCYENEKEICSFFACLYILCKADRVFCFSWVISLLPSLIRGKRGGKDGKRRGKDGKER